MFMDSGVIGLNNGDFGFEWMFEGFQKIHYYFINPCL